MAQNVRGQTLIDAIVQVFQGAARDERSLTADEVARRVRSAGFWGGKEPKAAEQMVESYLSTRHAGMFEPGPNRTFTLKSVFLRPAARAAAAAAAPATGASSTTPPPRAAARPMPAPPSRPAAAPAVARPAEPNVTAARPKRKSFGSAAVTSFVPVGHDGPLPEAITAHLSFAEAMNLHLSLGRLLARLSEDGPAGKGRRRSAAKLRVDLAKHRIAVYERPLKSARPTDRDAAARTVDWGVEPG